MPAAAVRGNQAAEYGLCGVGAFTGRGSGSILTSMNQRQILTALIGGVYSAVDGYYINDDDMNGFIAAAKLFNNLAVTQRTNPRIYIKQFIDEFSGALGVASRGTVESEIREAVNQ